jgi:DNA-binding NtrC family response regulator
VRELRNLVRTGEAVAPGKCIDAVHLRAGQAQDGGGERQPGEGCRRLRDLEREAILEALQACGGNRSRAAQRLGIDRSTLRRKMREFVGDPAAAPDAPTANPPQGRLFK